jgi:hypothetical protein
MVFAASLTDALTAIDTVSATSVSGGGVDQTTGMIVNPGRLMTRGGKA